MRVNSIHCFESNAESLVAVEIEVLGSEIVGNFGLVFGYRIRPWVAVEHLLLNRQDKALQCRVEQAIQNARCTFSWMPRKLVQLFVPIHGFTASILRSHVRGIIDEFDVVLCLGDNYGAQKTFITHSVGVNRKISERKQAPSSCRGSMGNEWMVHVGEMWNQWTGIDTRVWWCRTLAFSGTRTRTPSHRRMGRWRELGDEWKRQRVDDPLVETVGTCLTFHLI